MWIKISTIFSPKTKHPCFDQSDTHELWRGIEGRYLVLFPLIWPIYLQSQQLEQQQCQWRKNKDENSTNRLTNMSHQDDFRRLWGLDHGGGENWPT